MIDAIARFFTETVGREWCVFFCSMLPIIELRGAIPLGAGMGLPWWQSYLISVVGNLLPVPFILFFIQALIRWMAQCRWRGLQKFAGWLLNKVERHRGKLDKYTFWGLFLFVAIPIPGTGAWTGSLIAAMIGVKWKKAFGAITLGVLTAGVIMTIIAYGIAAILSFLG